MTIEESRTADVRCFEMLFELEEQLKANSREGATFRIRLEIEAND